MGTLVCEEKQQSEAEPNGEQLLSHNSAGTEIQDEEGSRHVDSGSTKEEEEPKSKKRRLKTGSHSNGDDDSVTSDTLFENKTDAPQLHDCKEEEVLTVQQLCNQERNSSLDQQEHNAAQVKEEEEELCSSQEEEDFGVKQETDAFMVTPTDEDNDKSETEPNSEQLLCHNSADTESQDQGAGKNVKPGSSKHEEPKKRLHRKRSDRNNVDKSSMSENQCDTDTGEKSGTLSQTKGTGASGSFKVAKAESKAKKPAKKAPAKAKKPAAKKPAAAKKPKAAGAKKAAATKKSLKKAKKPAAAKKAPKSPKKAAKSPKKVAKKAPAAKKAAPKKAAKAKAKKAAPKK
ncbi:uncharacterized protein KZ484_010885 [Pholidichthys leucotaenia]